MIHPTEPRNRRILVIDDNRAIHDDFRKILGSDRRADPLAALESDLFEESPPPAPVVYEIDSAFQGEEGLGQVERALAQGRPYALALVDIRMPPGWDGIETVSRIWRIDPDLQVVVCTAFSDYSWEEIDKRLNRPGQFLILKKPFDIIEVRQLAGSLTEKWTLAQTLKTRLEDLESAVRDRTRELEESLALSRATLESTADGILTISADHSHVNFNGKFLEIWRISEEEMLTQTYEERMQRAAGLVKDPDAFLGAIRSWDEDKGRTISDTIEFLDGRVVERYTRPQRLGDEIVGRVISLRDVTEARRSEEARRRSDEQWHAIIENEPEGVQILDAKGITLQINPAGVQILDIDPAAPVGRSFLDFLLPAYREPFRELMRRIFAGEKKGTLEFEIRTEKGESRWLDGHAVPLADHVLGQLTMLIVTRDLTERRSIEEQLRQSQKIEAIGKLAGGVAHDFNNLLTVINGHCQMLLQSPADEASLRGSLTEILKAGERAASLTRQLLAFSRKQILQPKVLDLNALIADTEKMLRRLIGEDIEYQFIQEAALWEIKVDPSQMVQVLMNLVLNSRDAMPRGGLLTLATSNVAIEAGGRLCGLGLGPGEYVRMTVADSGCGMDSKTMTRIFEPFYTSKEQGKGTGLGLAMAYGIVKQSHGAIDVESNVDVGTTFDIYLPRTREGRPCDAPGEGPAPIGAKNAATILIIEDEEGVRRLASEILAAQGYRVLQARLPDEALRIFDETPRIDLIVSDIVMPRMSGRQLAKLVRERRPDMRLLYISGYPDETIDNYGLADTKTPLLQKPFSPDSLVRKVQEILARPIVRDGSRPIRAFPDDIVRLPRRAAAAPQ